ncbi:13167_t:CDS:2 [Funneliformis geosporum]|uniref:13167_t:CDS:1 n=1 Tax=Funneliformis geosporum TaxID=1117311 RepID=A0A9W4WTW0_9GLOM|nr:13167_t:CDS:2 [Funneliformis geosporum]
MDISEHDDYLTDNGLCYAKVLLILRVTSIKLERNLELALVYWYDFAYPNNTTRHYFYKHAVLKHVEHYTLIPIASIANIVSNAYWIIIFDKYRANIRPTSFGTAEDKPAV